MSTILVNNIKDTGNNTLFTSDGSGNISSGGALTNTPAFLAYVSSNQDMTDETTTKANLDTTQIDTNSAFDTTNNKFTVPSGQAGTYYLHAQAVIGNADGSATNLRDHYLYIYKNGSSIGFADQNPNANWWAKSTSSISMVTDLAVNDYIEMFVHINVGTGNGRLDGFSSGQLKSFLYGYKLIGA